MGSLYVPPLRRSTRRRKVPVSYAVPDEDQMEGVKHTELPVQHQLQSKTRISHISTEEARFPTRYGPSSTIVQAQPMPFTTKVPYTTADPAQPHSRHQEAEPSDDSDGEYGVRPQKKKSKIIHLCENVSTGETGDKEEQVLRKICSSLGINFSLFDSWVEDPRLRDSSKLNIPFMPNEIMMEIFGHCRSEVLVQCERSCRRFQSLLKDNTRIWRQARLLYYPYPGLEAELPFNLDETSLFELATEKSCDYCESEKARPYYAWSIRSCHECIKSLTMSISEFKKMFKKKCDDEEDWTPYRREQVCNAIHWHRNPNYSKICWREYAYNLIEEAEDEMLAGSFDGWIKTKQISNAQRWKTRSLEIWGSTISKKMEEDRRGDETRIRKLRTACFHDWCMRLPRPIPEKTLTQTKAYWAFCRTSNYPTKSEFIRQLPKLLEERDCYEEKERRKEELRALYRIQQDSVLDRACSDIIQKVIEQGPLSALSWCAILRGALEQVRKASIEIKIPRGALVAVLAQPSEWKGDWDTSHVTKLLDLLEEKLYSRPETSPSKDTLHPASYEFFSNGDDRVLGCPGAALPSTCKCGEMMDFRELVSHMLSHYKDLPYPLDIWTSLQNTIIVHPAIRQDRPITVIGGKQYWQRELRVWFKPFPDIAGSEYSDEWVHSRYSGVFRNFMKQREKLGLLSKANTGTSTAEEGGIYSVWIKKSIGYKRGNENTNHKSIMAYFHVQKRPVVET